MDSSIWDIIKTIGGLLVVPFSGLVSWLWQENRKDKARQDNMEIRMIRLEIAKEAQEKKIDGVEDNVEKQFQAVNDKLDKIYQYLLDIKKK